MNDVKEFKIVRGTIESVEQIIVNLLAMNVGWEPRGVLFKMEVDKHEIVVQGMVRRATPSEEIAAFGFNIEAQGLTPGVD